MSYINKSLTKDESVLLKGEISLWAFVPRLIMTIFFSILIYSFFQTAIFAIALFVLAICSIFLTVISTELAATNKRVIAKFGFIRRETIELNINKIESIRVTQGILGRVFNFGSIVIAGAGNPSAPIPGIKNPLLFRSQFSEIQDELLGK